MSEDHLWGSYVSVNGRRVLPLAFMSGGKIYEWQSGSPLEWRKTKMLVRAECGADFWTWIDENGERVWDIVKE